MTKAEIANAIHARAGVTRKESLRMVEAILSEIKSTLESGEDVKISGFGHFLVREKSERMGRNPRTGEEVVILPRRVVTFRASPLLKDALLEDHE